MGHLSFPSSRLKSFLIVVLSLVFGLRVIWLASCLPFLPSVPFLSLHLHLLKRFTLARFFRLFLVSRSSPASSLCSSSPSRLSSLPSTPFLPYRYFPLLLRLPSSFFFFPLLSSLNRGLILTHQPSAAPPPPPSPLTPSHSSGSSFTQPATQSIPTFYFSNLHPPPPYPPPSTRSPTCFLTRL